MENINVVIQIIVGVATVAGAAMTVAAKWGVVSQSIKDLKENQKEFREDVRQSLKEFKEDINFEIREIKYELKDHAEEINILKGSSLLRHNSPMTLNEEGQAILDKSGVREIINTRLDQLYEKIIAKKPTNPYRVQMYAIEVAKELTADASLKDILETKAYETGASLSDILFVAGIYLRDQIMPRFDFKIEDIDLHDPKDTVLAKAEQ